MTFPSLEAFMNLICCQMVSKKEEIFKIIFETLYEKITKEGVAKIQTPEHTILRKFVDSNCYPFDMSNFSNHPENVAMKVSHEETKQVENFEKQGTPLAYTAKYQNKAKTKEYNIDLEHQSLVKEVRLLFGQTKSKSYRMDVKIYGQYGKKEVLLYSNTYDETMYCYLTQNSYLKEYKLYDESEEREGLCINNLNYVGRYIKIQLNFLDSFLTLNGNHPIVEDILPEVYGETRTTREQEIKEAYGIQDEVLAERDLVVGHSSPFKVLSLKEKPYSILKCSP